MTEQNLNMSLCEVSDPYRLDVFTPVRSIEGYCGDVATSSHKHTYNSYYYSRCYTSDTMKNTNIFPYT